MRQTRHGLGERGRDGQLHPPSTTPTPGTPAGAATGAAPGVCSRPVSAGHLAEHAGADEHDGARAPGVGRACDMLAADPGSAAGRTRSAALVGRPSAVRRASSSASLRRPRGPPHRRPRPWALCTAPSFAQLPLDLAGEKPPPEQTVRPAGRGPILRKGGPPSAAVDQLCPRDCERSLPAPSNPRRGRTSNAGGGRRMLRVPGKWHVSVGFPQSPMPNHGCAPMRPHHPRIGTHARPAHLPGAASECCPTWARSRRRAPSRDQRAAFAGRLAGPRKPAVCLARRRRGGSCW